MSLASQFVNLLAALLLLIAFAMLSQRRILTLIHLLAWQGAALSASTFVVAYSTGQGHLYYSAVLTVVLKVTFSVVQRVWLVSAVAFGCVETFKVAEAEAVLHAPLISTV